MEITVSNLPKSEVKIEVSVPASDTKVLYSASLKALGKNTKIAGFRPGKAPEDVIEKHFGKEKVFGYMLEMNLPTLYTKAIKEKELTPISRPMVDVVSEEPFVFSATFAVQPEVKIKGLDKIKIKAPEIAVTDKEMDETLDRLLSANSTMVEVDRASKKGDTVEINFEGFDADGTTIPGTKSENHPVSIGESMFIPGFEDNLIGLSKDEEKEFTVTFPEDYHVAELKSKPVLFKVKVTKVQEKQNPEIDEEFATKIFGEKMSKDDFVAKLKSELEHQKLHDQAAKQEDDLFDTLIKESEFEVSDILIEEETELLLEEMKQNITSRGLKFEDFVKLTESKEGKSINEFYKPKAEERVKIRFIIDFVIKNNKLEATEEEIAEKAQHKINHAPEGVQDQVKEYYKSGKPGHSAIRNQVLLDKFFNEFIERHADHHEHH
jgi:trigger factor